MRPFITPSRLAAALVLAASLHAAPALAQDRASVQGRGFQLRPIAGGFLPTGDQRHLLDDAALFGAQLGWRFHPNLAVTGSAGWAPSSDRTAAFAEEKVDVWQYDLGLEASRPVATFGSWLLSPYVGVGAGGRTYNYRDLDAADAQTNLLGYGALGFDFAPVNGPIGIRVEARDNVTAFKGLRGEYSDRQARNDVQIGGGITIRF